MKHDTVLTDDDLKAISFVGPVYAPDGAVQRTPQQYRIELETTRRDAAKKAEQAVIAKLEQRQEPVASIFVTPSGDREFDDWNHPLPVGQNLLYAEPPTTPEPAQEPVARVAEVHMSRYTIEWTNGPLPEGTPLYTTPQPTPALLDALKVFVWPYQEGCRLTDTEKQELGRAAIEAHQVGMNGLTGAETSASASVIGLSKDFQSDLAQGLQPMAENIRREILGKS